MKNKKIKKWLFGMFFLVLSFEFSVANAAVDKWGGDDRLPFSGTKYQTGTATSISGCEQTGPDNWCWTLNDTSKNWEVDELVGLILQPDADREVYFSIKSNTNNSITVRGSSIVDSDEEAKRSLEDENSGAEEYAVLDLWRMEKINNRWLWIDPYGNGFWAKGLNAYTQSGQNYGKNINGETWASKVDAQPIYGGNGTTTAGLAATLWHMKDLLKEQGFNMTGELNEFYYMVPGSHSNPSPVSTYKTPERYMPFTLFPRVNGLTLANTPNITINGSRLHDAASPDFKDDLMASINGCDGSASSTYGAITIFGEPNTDVDPACDSDRSELVWSDHLLTPYEKFKWNIPANPYVMGVKWDEEPGYVQQEYTTEHMGYRVFTSAATAPRKELAREYLDAAYNCSTDCAYGGFPDLVGKYANISALNSAWGTSYLNWDELMNDTGAIIDTILSNGPKANKTDSCVNSANKASLWGWAPCDEHSANPALADDLDGIAESFWRLYTKGVHDALLELFGGVDLLNMGPGYHGSKEWMSDGRGSSSPEYLFRGSVSADASEAYVDVISIGNVSGKFLSSSDESYFEWQGPKLKDFYDFHGRPYWITSTWLDAEADSGTTHTGIIDSVTTTSITDNSQDFIGSIGSQAYNANAPMTVICNAEDPISEWVFYKIDPTATTATTLNFANNWSTMFGPGEAWVSVPTDVAAHCHSGDTYYIFTQDNLANFDGYKTENPKPSIWFPLTQEERASEYVDYLTDMRQLQADNGDYVLTGFSHWSYWDFGFENYKKEKRNFGFMSVNSNLYDGSATIANGETQDCGDFVTPVVNKLNNLYDEILGVGDVEDPTAPAGLESTLVTSNQISLSWTESTDNTSVAGYKIFRNGIQVDTTFDASYSDTNLTPETAYAYAVSAYDAAGNDSDQSAGLAVTTEAAAPAYNLSNFISLIDNWLQAGDENSDINLDSTVDTRDLGIMMSNWSN
ncbi:MAG: hypothetical protein ACD_11C00020G0038 [uncultured bacterium]|nr:MAG: hypothetical protein ACD_11C00020G0038 [uncultured bacterium]HBR71323.1 hypothetical protein [Candidatus Moranbacteria bacterium]